MRTLIDTRPWVLALKRALYPPESVEHSLGAVAAKVIEQALADDEVLVSGQLLGEIYAVGVGRGRKLRGEVVIGYLDAVLATPSVQFRVPEAAQYRAAAEDSSRSGIHVWDFLVVAPFRDRVERIVTMDPHFRHPVLAGSARIDNPFELWRTEGER